MTRKQKRLMILGGFGLVLVSALALILTGLRDQIVFFRSPSEVMAGKVKAGEAFRLGGLVEKGSVLREPNQMVRFRVTDGSNAIAVTYRGLLPDLFREGQGVVTEGRLDASGAFTASTVLARHDENYMPREVADALKQQGHWQPGKGDGPPKP
ncbi:MAG: cytochrome c maturation protein CcmE [Methylobacterium sp.]|jgi:cytochrome c-type biogenesis protein CcmE|nr:cytochrome c maturation protein CcmE [Methylobacterium sp.]MCA3596615.1 cytochrome c maturation protein CcmE [Methylobacterium sp.]MCA3600584.1 cytochrome c maturation protein CcmE [Methylobacterium sp.]MCA3603275.1 cytochrome c maturation protein CcmE [Methylobacterium sp.]MCA3605165.1 cytochrome c maturation protein CcmE [Methylobacterium sp.]